ncbi:hypothetical protein ACPV5S_19025 [Vibrio astriarenae]
MKYIIQLLVLMSISFGAAANKQIGVGVGFHFGEKEIEEHWEDDFRVHGSLMYNEPGKLYTKVASDFKHYHTASAGISIPVQPFEYGSASIGIGGGVLDYEYSDDNWVVSLMFASNLVYHNLGQGATIDFNSDMIALNYFIAFIQ